MTVTTILRDNREQKPYEFDNYAVTTEDVTLRTGDYTIAELCEHDGENDTYHPLFAVERKTASDFLNSITSDRDRFQKEIKRASDWEHQLEVVVEESWTVFQRNIGVMKQRKAIHPNHVTGTVDSWTEHYNVNFRFAGDRFGAEKYTYDTLMECLRAYISR